MLTKWFASLVLFCGVMLLPLGNTTLYADGGHHHGGSHHHGHGKHHKHHHKHHHGHHHDHHKHHHWW